MVNPENIHTPPKIVYERTSAISTNVSGIATFTVDLHIVRDAWVNYHGAGVADEAIVQVDRVGYSGGRNSVDVAFKIVQPETSRIINAGSGISYSGGILEIWCRGD